MLLKEKRKSDDMFQCGVKKCDMQFRTAVGYVYHLNSSHGFAFDTFVKCRNFITEFNTRLYGKGRGTQGFYVEKLTFNN